MSLRFQIKWPKPDTILSLTQTAGIIATLVLTTVLAVRSEHAQSNHDSADFMLKFDEHIHSGPGGAVARILDREGKLDNLHLNKSRLDDALGDFFGNYELLNEVYKNGLIEDDMSYDAFVYDLEKALQDTKAREYLAASIQEDSDLYAGVFELAKDWGIQFSPIFSSKGSTNLVPK